MKKCLITQLQESVTDTSLPVFQNVVLKNYAKRTSVSQYIDIASIIPSLGFSDAKIDATIKLLELSTSSERLLQLRGETVFLGYSFTKGFTVKASSTEGNLLVIPYSDVPKNVDINVGLTFDSNRYPTMYFGEETLTTEIAGSPGSTQDFARIFNGTGVSGYVLIKSLKIKKISTDELLLDAVPALVNNRPCLLNLVDGTPLYPNTGELVVS